MSKPVFGPPPPFSLLFRDVVPAKSFLGDSTLSRPFTAPIASSDSCKAAIEIVKKSALLTGNTLVTISSLFGISLALENENLKNVLVLDPSKRSSHFLRKVVQIAKKCLKASDAIDEIKKILVANKDFYFKSKVPGETTHFFEESFKAFHNYSSFLFYSDAVLLKFKNLFIDGRCAFVPCDLTDFETLTMINLKMQSHGYRTAALYLSNSFEYVVNFYDKSFEAMEAFAKGVTTLMPAEGALILATKPRECRACDMPVLEVCHHFPQNVATTIFKPISHLQFHENCPTLKLRNEHVKKLAEQEKENRT